MKIGWSIQRHVSVKGVIELLTMMSSGEPIERLESGYYARMDHSYTMRLKNEEIFNRNASFLQLYLEVLDDKRSLRPELRNLVQTNEAAGVFVYRRSLENILAFRILVDITSSEAGMNKKDLQRVLGEGLLSEASREYPSEYEKKVKELRKKYGSEKSWIYPHASLDRLLEILKLGSSGTLTNSQIPGGRIEKGQDPLVFREHIYGLNGEIVRESGQQIVSIDIFKKRFLDRWSIGSEIFDDLFLALLESDRSILDFSGKMGDEKGLVRRNGKHVYRFTIQG